MTDGKLLELAAKAAKVFATPSDFARRGWVWEARDEIVFNPETGALTGTRFWYASSGDEGGTERFEWNPLTDDGDALRLAVKLKLQVLIGQGPTGDITWVRVPEELDMEGPSERHGDDARAATRRAIVRAAAEIGKVTQ